MDRRTHHRLAQPLSPLGQGLGVPQPEGLGVLAPGLNPPSCCESSVKTIMIPDRLLDPRALEQAAKQMPHARLGQDQIRQGSAAEISKYARCERF